MADFKLKKKDVINLTIALLLLNPKFLDGLLDQGKKGKYVNDSNVYIQDLMTLLIKKSNRLSVGEIKGALCRTINKDVSHIFNDIDDIFDIEADWNKLSNARDFANNIRTNLEVNPQDINHIYWTSSETDTDYPVDIVIEKTSGEQIAIFLDKKPISNKTVSLTTFLELITDTNLRLWDERYMKHWDELATKWYNFHKENDDEALVNVMKQMEPGEMSWVEYLIAQHSDPKKQYLGEYVEELDRHYKELHVFLSDVAKNLWNEETLSRWQEQESYIIEEYIVKPLLIKALRSQWVGRKGKWIGAKSELAKRLSKYFIDQLHWGKLVSYYVWKRGEEMLVLPPKNYLKGSEFSVWFTHKDENMFEINIEMEGETIYSAVINWKWSGDWVTEKISVKWEQEITDNWNKIIEAKS